MAFLSEDEKRSLRQKQGLLYSSGQFPLKGTHSGPSRRARRPMSPLKALVTGLAVGLLALVALVVLLTKAASAAVPAPLEVGGAGAVAPEHDGERADAEQRRRH